jgi:hypothetical protein
MKFIHFYVLSAILFFAFNMAWADEKKHKSTTKITNVTEVTTINNYSTKGIASAISAAQCHFDGGSFDLQLCGAVGYSDNQEAFTFGIGKKYKDFLINGTVSVEDNKARYGVGLNWKIK